MTLTHILDATNPKDGNWMRYVNSARYFEEQNIVSTQIGQEVYYKAMKVMFFLRLEIDWTGGLL